MSVSDAPSSVPMASGHLPPFTGLRIFDAVGTHGGIRRAAAALDMDHSAVSRHLKALEQWAGVVLVNRGAAMGSHLTAEGAQFHARITRAMQEIMGASLDLTRRGENHQLRLWCAPGIASKWLSERLGQFSQTYPQIDLELNPTDQWPNFRTHQADCLLHYVRDSEEALANDPLLRSEAVLRPKVIAVASPILAARYGGITKLEELMAAPLLHEADFDQWRRWFARQGVPIEGPLAGPRFGQAHLTLSAAYRGQGVALANVLLLGDSLASGQLVRVGPWPSVHLGAYHITARRDRWRDGVVSHFRGWLRQMIAQDGEPGEA